MIDAITTASAFSLVVILLVSSVTDIAWHRIPNLLLLPGLVLAIGLQVNVAGIAGLVTAICGLFLGLAMLLPLYVMGGMGAGDVKLLGIVGAFLGPAGVLVAGVATFIVGAVFGLAIMSWRTLHPVLNNVIGLGFPGSDDPTSARLPTSFAYAPAIALGSIFALSYSGSL